MVALASQISIGLVGSDFRISAGIILFVLLLLYKDLRPIVTGLISGIMVYLVRLLVYFLVNKSLDGVIISYQLEILFYLFYSIIFDLLMDREKKEKANFIFYITIISDFGANLIEAVTRTSITDSFLVWGLMPTLLLAAIVRSGIIWLGLNLLKYYRMLLIREEHEKRYRKLLWLTSELKTEMYWMEKNMDNIEKVMSNSYELFEKIKSNEDRDTWATRAISIARDIHEIKKENELVVRGLKEITENQLKDKGMNLKDIISILSETMKREAKRLEKDIVFTFHIEGDFYTQNHYYLMSILRNLIMNSIDAVSNLQREARISVNYRLEKDQHIFKVSDNGIGIDEENLKDVFLPGFSTKIDYSTGKINRGLGLSVVKHMVEEELNGKVSVSSKKGKGTTFNIYIPKDSLEVVGGENIHSGR
ncbi:MAG: sensor histidine kinase [Tissierellia bacterium]|nr:sensor histidine kinase [Tissierellia bacterium]